MEEKRKHARVPLVIKVTNRGTKEFHFFYSTDISIGGMFLETRDPYPMDTDIELDFFLQIKDRKERLVISAKVIRVQPFDINAEEQPVPGMGIRFNDPKPETLVTIGNFIRLTLETSEE